MNPVQLDPAIKEAVKQAADRGWEAIVLVIVMVGLISLTGVIVRWLIASMDKRMEEANQREQRMAQRLTQLEDFSQVTLVRLIDETSQLAANVVNAITTLTVAMEHRPCLLPGSSDQINEDTRKRTQLKGSHSKPEVQ